MTWIPEIRAIFLATTEKVFVCTDVRGISSLPKVVADKLIWMNELRQAAGLRRELVRRGGQLLGAGGVLLRDLAGLADGPVEVVSRSSALAPACWHDPPDRALPGEPERC